MKYNIIIFENILSSYLRAKKIVFRLSNKFSTEYKIEHGLKMIVTSIYNQEKYVDYIYIEAQQPINLNDQIFSSLNVDLIYKNNGDLIKKILFVNGKDILNLSRFSNNRFDIEKYLTNKYKKHTYIYDDYYLAYKEYHKKMDILTDEQLKLADKDVSKVSVLLTNELKAIYDFFQPFENLNIIKNGFQNNDPFIFLLKALRDYESDGIDTIYSIGKRARYLVKLFQFAVKKQ